MKFQGASSIVVLCSLARVAHAEIALTAQSLLDEINGLPVRVSQNALLLSPSSVDPIFQGYFQNGDLKLSPKTGQAIAGFGIAVQDDGQLIVSNTSSTTLFYDHDGWLEYDSEPIFGLLRSDTGYDIYVNRPDLEDLSPLFLQLAEIAYTDGNGNPISSTSSTGTTPGTITSMSGTQQSASHTGLSSNTLLNPDPNGYGRPDGVPQSHGQAKPVTLQKRLYIEGNQMDNVGPWVTAKSLLGTATYNTAWVLATAPYQGIGSPATVTQTQLVTVTSTVTEEDGWPSETFPWDAVTPTETFPWDASAPAATYTQDATTATETFPWDAQSTSTATHPWDSTSPISTTQTETYPWDVTTSTTATAIETYPWDATTPTETYPWDATTSTEIPPWDIQTSYISAPVLTTSEVFPWDTTSAADSQTPSSLFATETFPWDQSTTTSRTSRTSRIPSRSGPSHASGAPRSASPSTAVRHSTTQSSSHRAVTSSSAETFPWDVVASSTSVRSSSNSQATRPLSTSRPAVPTVQSASTRTLASLSPGSTLTASGRAARASSNAISLRATIVAPPHSTARAATHPPLTTSTSSHSMIRSVRSTTSPIIPAGSASIAPPNVSAPSS